MTAGSGIVHSERTADEPRRTGHRIHAIQSWVALPREREEIAPAFVHHPASTLPVVETDGARITVIAGSLHGETSPVATQSTLFYADAALAANARLALPAEHEERAIYVAQGRIEIDGDGFDAGRLLVLRPGASVVLRAAAAATRCMLLGGASFEEPRHVWWNFVSSSRERIEQAKQDWRAQRFAAVPDEHERIPLPE
jgi:redox-sensitive bicupin YhaK (pirin superfamily)